MSTKTLLTGAILLISAAVFSQEKQNHQYVGEQQTVVQPLQSDAQKTKALRDELQGTYEFEISSAGYNPLITLDMLEQIRSSRLESTNAYIHWDDHTTIVVFPRTVIEQVENE